jgi:hypothetical protein
MTLQTIQGSASGDRYGTFFALQSLERRRHRHRQLRFQIRKRGNENQKSEGSPTSTWRREESG